MKSIVVEMIIEKNIRLCCPLTLDQNLNWVCFSDLKRRTLMRNTVWWNSFYLAGVKPWNGTFNCFEKGDQFKIKLASFLVILGTFSRGKGLRYYEYIICCNMLYIVSYTLYIVTCTLHIIKYTCIYTYIYIYRFVIFINHMYIYLCNYVFQELHHGIMAPTIWAAFWGRAWHFGCWWFRVWRICWSSDVGWCVRGLTSGAWKFWRTSRYCSWWSRALWPRGDDFL